MGQKRILIVEDEKTSALILQKSLASHGFPADIAVNGAQGLEMYEKYHYPIVITDLDMPVLDGEELIRRLQSLNPIPVIFVETANADPDTIIKIMKLGVYDYIIKPINTNDLNLKINHAFESAEIRRIKAISDKERIVRLDNQLDWYKWQDKIKNRSIKKLDQSLFHSLKTSFSQGAGFGSLLTVINIVASSAKEENDTFIVEKDVFDLMTSNVAMAEKALTAFEDIDHINSSVMPLENITFPELHAFISHIAESHESQAALKKHRIKISDIKPELTFIKTAINKNYFTMAVNEILINAFKFSEPNTDIIIILERLGNNFEIEFLSIPIPDDEGHKGIPMEYENLVFEPFFRMTKKIFEEYGTLDFGIGLTLVENIIAKHKAKISASTVTDYSGTEKTGIQRVSIAINLPIIP